MWIKEVYIDKSNIHGNGLFAGEDIKKGETIWKYDDKSVKTWTEDEWQEELEKSSPEKKKALINFAYKDCKDNTWYLHLDEMSYTNHSEDPTVKTEGTSSDNYKTIARKDIKKGEELTENYKEYYDKDIWKYHNCLKKEASRSLSKRAANEILLTVCRGVTGELADIARTGKTIPLAYGGANYWLVIDSLGDLSGVDPVLYGPGYNQCGVVVAKTITLQDIGNGYYKFPKGWYQHCDSDKNKYWEDKAENWCPRDDAEVCQYVKKEEIGHAEITSRMPIEDYEVIVDGKKLTEMKNRSDAPFLEKIPIRDYEEEGNLNKKKIWTIENYKDYKENYPWGRGLKFEKASKKKSFETPEDLLDWMKENVKYGWIDKDGGRHPGDAGDEDPENFWHNYKLQTPDELRESKLGVCWDQVEFEREFFEEKGIPYKTIMMVQNCGPNNYPSHTFLIYKEDKQWKLFEAADSEYRGIYDDCDTIEEYCEEVHKRMEKRNKDKEFEYKIYDKPKAGINGEEFYKHCDFEEFITEESEEIEGHCEDVLNADINYPIFITKDEEIIDGAHRTIKCLIEDKEVPVIVLTQEMLDKVELDPNENYKGQMYVDEKGNEYSVNKIIELYGEMEPEKYLDPKKLIEKNEECWGGTSIKEVIRKVKKEASKQEYHISGIVKNCLDGDYEDYNLKIDEELTGDPWGAILSSAKPLSKEELNDFHSKYTLDPDEKGIPYYYIVRQDNKEKQIRFQFDNKFYTVDEAKKVGKELGIPKEQLDFKDTVDCKVFLWRLNDRPKDLPEVDLKGKYWHCGFIYDDKIYECFSKGKYEIKDYPDNSDYLGDCDIVNVKVDLDKIKEYIKDGLPCDNYVNKVLGLPMNKNKDTVEVNFTDEMLEFDKMKKSASRSLSKRALNEVSFFNKKIWPILQNMAKYLLQKIKNKEDWRDSFINENEEIKYGMTTIVIEVFDDVGGGYSDYTLDTDVLGLEDSSLTLSLIKNDDVVKYKDDILPLIDKLNKIVNNDRDEYLKYKTTFVHELTHYEQNHYAIQFGIDPNSFYSTDEYVNQPMEIEARKAEIYLWMKEYPQEFKTFKKGYEFVKKNAQFDKISYYKAYEELWKEVEDSEQYENLISFANRRLSKRANINKTKYDENPSNWPFDAFLELGGYHDDSDTYFIEGQPGYMPLENVPRKNRTNYFFHTHPYSFTKNYNFITEWYLGDCGYLEVDGLNKTKKFAQRGISTAYIVEVLQPELLKKRIKNINKKYGVGIEYWEIAKYLAIERNIDFQSLTDCNEKIRKLKEEVRKENLTREIQIAKQLPIFKIIKNFYFRVLDCRIDFFIFSEKEVQNTIEIMKKYKRISPSDWFIGTNIVTENGEYKEIDSIKNITKKLSKRAGDVGSIHTIKSNPDKSKHLETATMKIFGLDIDFVNLRKDTYTQDSRIPTVECGTPEEDAHRRDLTINALFYNINEDKIEDYCGGIEDLKKGILRSPLDPLETLNDDPLRLLRWIRFAARFNFEIAPELIKAAQDPKIKEAFKTKVSRERILKELKGMMTSQYPERAMEYIKEMGYLDEIFPTESVEKFKGQMDSWDMPHMNPHHPEDLWTHIMNVLRNRNQMLGKDVNDDKKFLINLTAFVHDIAKRYKGVHQYKEEPGFGTKRTYHQHEDFGAEMFRELGKSLHMSANDIETISTLIKNHMRPHDLIDSKSDKALRKFVADLGDLWEDCVDQAKADCMGKEKIVPGEAEKYDQLKEKIRNMQSTTPVQTKPILSGHEVMQLLNRKPGPWLGDLNKRILDWQLENPTATKEDLKDWIVKNANNQNKTTTAFLNKTAFYYIPTTSELTYLEGLEGTMQPGGQASSRVLDRLGDLIVTGDHFYLYNDIDNASKEARRLQITNGGAPMILVMNHIEKIRFDENGNPYLDSVSKKDIGEIKYIDGTPENETIESKSTSYMGSPELF